MHGATNYGIWSDASDLKRNPFTDARKFENGSVSYHGVLGAAKSFEVLQSYSVDKLWKKTLELRSHLGEQLRELGFAVYGDEKATGPQVAFIHPKVPLLQLSQALLKEKISHALKPAPVEGARVLRLSPHAYNTTDDLNLALKTLKRALA